MNKNQMNSSLPGWIHVAVLCVLALLPIPPALIWQARCERSAHPRVHPIGDMDNQKYYRKQARNIAFTDGRAMRLPVRGTVALGELHADDHYWRGTVAGAWAKSFPAKLSVDKAFLKRGADCFDIFCAPCHGFAGYGDGIVAARGSKVSPATWVEPTDLHSRGEGGKGPANQEVGLIYSTITNGKNSMPHYAAQIPVNDRWAIVAYVRALQISQGK